MKNQNHMNNVNLTTDAKANLATNAKANLPVNANANLAVNANAFELAFRSLNDELVIIGESLELVCAGGYVMQLNGYRSTLDIDAFYNSNAAINEAIRKVGDELGINKPDELWLNNSISNLNPEPTDRYTNAVCQYSNLVVKTVNLVYLMGMKLVSAREQDLMDVSDILKNHEGLQPLELLSDLTAIGFEVDIAILLDAYERVRGMEWLETFYKEKESVLRMYF